MTLYCVILQGLPGSGKTTYAESFITRPGVGSVSIVSTDLFFTDPKIGTYNFDPNLLGKAHAACKRQFIEELLWFYKLPPDDPVGDAYLIVDNTNSTPLEVAPYYEMALAFGAETRIEYIISEVDASAERNVHGVPLAAIQKLAWALDTFKGPTWWIRSYVGPFPTK